MTFQEDTTQYMRHIAKGAENSAAFLAEAFQGLIGAATSVQDKEPDGCPCNEIGCNWPRCGYRPAATFIGTINGIDK